MKFHHDPRNISVRLFIMVLLCLLLIFFSTISADISAKETRAFNADSIMSEDAIVLTLRIQDGIWLDTTLALEIDRVLDEVKSEYDTLVNIHTCPEYYTNQIILNSDASWTQAWRNGELITGNAVIDSLTSVYHMIALQYSVWDCFLLTFSQPLNMPLLAQEYEEISGIRYADPCYIDRAMGCTEEIIALEKENLLNVVFCHTLGGYPKYVARHCWYFSATENGEVQLVEEMSRGSAYYLYAPLIYRWNVPPNYAATAFSSVDELLLAAQFASEWWVRRHAVEVIGRLYKYDVPWAVGDNENISIFEEIRDGVRSRKADIFSLLRYCMDDSDSDVKSSTQMALNRLLGFPEESLACYYPLHIGNSWTFTTHTETIVDTQRIDGDLYFRFEDGALKRMTEDNKLVERYDTTEYVWVDFSADIGDSWSLFSECFEVSLVSKEMTMEVPAGTFTNCYKFLFSCCAIDCDFAEWYAPGVGLVIRSCFCPVQHELIHAVMNGIEIGSLKGDVDGNGELNAADVIFTVNIIIGLLNPTPAQFWAADMNGDGKVNVLDIVMIANMILEGPFSSEY